MFRTGVRQDCLHPNQTNAAAIENSHTCRTGVDSCGSALLPKIAVPGSIPAFYRLRLAPALPPAYLFIIENKGGKT
jgi:hypothetical protein